MAYFTLLNTGRESGSGDPYPEPLFVKGWGSEGVAITRREAAGDEVSQAGL